MPLTQETLEGSVFLLLKYNSHLSPELEEAYRQYGKEYILPPTNVDVPAVTLNGAIVTEAAVGDTLHCTMGNWENEPTAYEYQWMRDDVDIEELGGGPDYVITDADKGMTLNCVVTAGNLGGVADAPMSNPIEVPA